MRIQTANIPTPAGKSTPSLNSTAADKARLQSTEARDSYRKNRSSQIIDAEYVEFYTPSTNIFAKERNILDNTLGPAQEAFEVAESNDSTNNTAGLSRYQLKTHEAPPPGSYLDIFA